MSQTLAAPVPGNVVPFPRPPGAGGPPPGMVPNPAYAAWHQQAAKVQAVMQANAQKQAQFDAAVALIKKDGIHGFRLDIEADSTIAPDEEAEKRARVEFLQQMIPMLEQVVPIAQGNPPLATLAKEMTLFAVRGFRVARSLEEAFEAAFDAVAQMPPNPKMTGQQQKGAPQQNPQVEAAKVAADVHDTQTKAQTDQLAIAQKAQQAQMQVGIAQDRLAAEQQNDQTEIALRAMEMQQRSGLEQSRMAALAARGARGLI